METVLLSDGGLHVSEDRHTKAHALPWHKVIVPLDGGEVLVRSANGELRTRSPVLTAANVRTCASTLGANMGLFFSPASDSFRITDMLRNGVQVFEGSRGKALIDICRTLSLGDSAGGIIEVQRAIQPGTAGGRSLDARVQGAKEQLHDGNPIRAEALAASLGLSVSRLSHLFSQEMGISLRAYSLFRRLIKAYGLKKQHPNLAAVAFEAGFSDHAHLTRTARRFLGQPASYGGRIVQA